MTGKPLIKIFGEEEEDIKGRVDRVIMNLVATRDEFKSIYNVDPVQHWLYRWIQNFKGKSKPRPWGIETLKGQPLKETVFCRDLFERACDKGKIIPTKLAALSVGMTTDGFIWCIQRLQQEGILLYHPFAAYDINMVSSPFASPNFWLQMLGYYGPVSKDSDISSHEVCEQIHEFLLTELEIPVEKALDSEKIATRLDIITGNPLSDTNSVQIMDPNYPMRVWDEVHIDTFKDIKEYLRGVQVSLPGSGGFVDLNKSVDLVNTLTGETTQMDSIELDKNGPPEGYVPLESLSTTDMLKVLSNVRTRLQK